MKDKRIAVECACGHLTWLCNAPSDKKEQRKVRERCADMPCVNCEFNGNDDMDYCDVHDIWFKLGKQCWKCDYKVRQSCNKKNQGTQKGD